MPAEFCGKYERHRSHVTVLPPSEPVYWTPDALMTPITEVSTFVQLICHGWPTPWRAEYPPGKGPVDESPAQRIPLSVLLDLLNRHSMDVPNNPFRRLVWKAKRVYDAFITEWKSGGKR